MAFELLACDMDGTALDREKRLSADNIQAMETALQRGKHVVFCTGRNIPLVLPYSRLVRGMRYAVLCAGANVKDLAAGTELLDRRLDPAAVLRVLHSTAGSRYFPVFYRGDVSCGPDWVQAQLETFHAEEFAETYRRYLTFEPNMMDTYFSNPVPLRKLNLFFSAAPEKAAVSERIGHYDMTVTAQSPYYLELTAPGVTKKSGLEALCVHLGLSLDQCIAVGDAENDVEVLRAAGLGLAVENATPEALSAADAVVADCGHDGVAEAIHRFLLA